jgi:hypothetical protein
LWAEDETPQQRRSNMVAAPGPTNKSPRDVHRGAICYSNAEVACGSRRQFDPVSGAGWLWAVSCDVVLLFSAEVP